MRYSIWLLLVLALSPFATFSANNTFITLNYHDIIPEEERVPPFDRVAVCQEHLESHFAWLKKSGYHVVSYQDIVNASKGGKALPDKAILLTFDDGYELSLIHI